MKAVNGGLHHQTQILLARIFGLPIGIVKTCLGWGRVQALRLTVTAVMLTDAASRHRKKLKTSR